MHCSMLTVKCHIHAAWNYAHTTARCAIIHTSTQDLIAYIHTQRRKPSFSARFYQHSQTQRLSVQLDDFSHYIAQRRTHAVSVSRFLGGGMIPPSINRSSQGSNQPPVRGAGYSHVLRRSWSRVPGEPRGLCSRNKKERENWDQGKRGCRLSTVIETRMVLFGEPYIATYSSSSIIKGGHGVADTVLYTNLQ